MRHSNVIPYIELESEQLTISDIAHMIASFYEDYSKKDSRISGLNIISDRNIMHNFISLNEDYETIAQLLAEEILHQNIDAIRKRDEIKEVDLNYSGNAVIYLGVEVKYQEETLFSLAFSFDATLQSKITGIMLNESCFNNYDQMLTFIKSINASFNVLYATIKIKDRDFTRQVRIYKAVLGVVNYVSANYQIVFPNRLDGLEYTSINQGKFMIISGLTSPFDSENHHSNKELLLTIMREIALQNPKYLKN